MKRKMWSIQEERELQKLAEEKNSIELMASKLKKTQKAVYMKLYTLGLLDKEERVKKNSVVSSSSSVIETIKKEIPTPAEALRFLACCMEKLQKGGLSKVDILQIRTSVQTMTAYYHLYGKFVDYAGLENLLLELNKKYDRLLAQKESKNTAH